MIKQFFALCALVTVFNFTTMGYSETVVSLHPTTDIAAAAVGEQVKIDIRITDGKGVAGYSPVIAFDSTALRFVDATSGGYLAANGIWMTPQLKDDGSYEVRLAVGASTTTGASVDFPPLPDAPGVTIEEITAEQLLFKVSLPEPPPEFVLPGSEYWTFSILASAPLGADTKPIATDGDGTLATLTFEVVEAKPSTVALLNVNLQDSNDDALLAILQEDSRITVNASDVPGAAAADVNSDGEVNILDLVVVAGKLGEPVTDENKAADVNADDTINIQDLVIIAQYLGN